MELFFTNNISGSEAILDPEESRHCVKVLRHKRGDEISFIDGKGGLYKGEVSETSGNTCKIKIKESIQKYMARGYFLHMAVAPTKNLERYEWFMEKATELGMDELTPIIGDHSERKVFKPERGERILLSATKQSLKACVPVLNPMTTAKKFIMDSAGFNGIKLIAHCNEGSRTDLVRYLEYNVPAEKGERRFLILIGPEGDFSTDEVALAVSHGFLPITLGESRLRTETAALTTVAAIYFLGNHR
ncbi:MAG: 16S rRNA (uracil(1498)-N(3))-methyltransferase [Bacteroidales bacterium]|jgi:16S rRNA (uracil1498-N3)-methyltransferase